MDDEVKSTTAEPTVEAESSTAEPQTTDTQETPIVESNETEKEVSNAVPYERFKEVNDQVRELKEMVSAMQTPQQPQNQGVQEDIPDLDPDSARAVDMRARQIYEQQEAKKFEAKFAKEFTKDPLLKGAFMVEVQNRMAKGEYIDREAALEQAKSALNERLNVQVQVAKEAGVKEGQDIAKTKQQLGAVGETGKLPEVSDENLSPSEYRQKYNIPVGN